MANLQKLIDLDGLSYFLGQIKAKFVRSVNGGKPDSKGNVNIANMEGATSNAAGKAGLVPIPAAGKQDMALCGDATFRVLPIAGGGTGADNASDACANLGALSTTGGTMIGGIKWNGIELKGNGSNLTWNGKTVLVEEASDLDGYDGYIKLNNDLVFAWANPNFVDYDKYLTVVKPTPFTTINAFATDTTYDGSTNVVVFSWDNKATTDTTDRFSTNSNTAGAVAIFWIGKVV